MTKLLKIFIVMAVLGSIVCIDDPLNPLIKPGKAKIALTNIKASSSTQVNAYFNNSVSAVNADSQFAVLNASTLDSLSVGAISIEGQKVELSLGAYMTAGHIYTIYYSNVLAADTTVLASGIKQFTATFAPDDPPDLTIHEDSVGNLLLLWQPNKRVGNTQIELWQRRLFDSVHVADFPATQSGHWISQRIADTRREGYALKVSNPYSTTGDLSSWTAPTMTSDSLFNCLNVCLTNLVWTPDTAGYVAVPFVTDCYHVEYYNDSLKTSLFREFSVSGVVEITLDSLGDTLSQTAINPCP